MPSANTKPLASRVSKDEYFMLLREAAERQMTLSQFVKDVVIGDFISKLNKPNLLAEKGAKLPDSPNPETLKGNGLFELIEVLPPKDLYADFYFYPYKEGKGEVTLGAVPIHNRSGSKHSYPEEKELLFSSIYTSKGRYFLKTHIGNELYEFDLNNSPLLSIKEGNLYFNRHPHHHHPSWEPQQARFGKKILYSISSTKFLK
jgi:hypothetical protein